MIDLSAFNTHSCQVIDKKIPNMSPRHILEALELFNDSNSCQSLISSAINALRSQQLDISKFSLAELATIVDFVATYESSENPVFFNFVDSCLESGFYKMQTSNDFDNFANLVYVFTKEGLFTVDGVEKEGGMKVSDGSKMY
jgi:hypothetical protein